TSGRSDLAIGGWYIFQDHPFGVGTGGFPTAWSRLGHHYGLRYGRGEEKAAHSGWVKTMVENGVPGLVLLIIYISSFGVVALRQRDWALWRLGMLTSVATAAALLSTEFQNKGVWFLVAGATAFLQRDRMVIAMYGRVPEREQHFPGNDDLDADPDEQ
ncbi:MAG TPA: O-antigen ligase family protein, partial [Gemmatimonadaceae bacterium]